MHEMVNSICGAQNPYLGDMVSALCLFPISLSTFLVANEFFPAARSFAQGSWFNRNADVIFVFHNFGGWRRCCHSGSSRGRGGWCQRGGRYLILSSCNFVNRTGCRHDWFSWLRLLRGMYPMRASLEKALLELSVQSRDVKLKQKDSREWLGTLQT